jgi:cytochrome c biogenesis protein
MKTETNPVWQFLSSIRLALFILFTLAAASIPGTIIPQGQRYEQYVDQYGANLANLFHVLDFTHVYSSWWFVSLLMLFSLNLIVCTFDCLPRIWGMVTKDNLKTDVQRLEKMPQSAVFHTAKPVSEAADTVRSVLSGAGWKLDERKGGTDTLLFSQKGAWTRLGVIAVHVSILLVFLGAIIGSVFGFKGSIMLPEGSETDFIFLHDEANTRVPLGFTLRADRFDMSFYDNGMIREYRSDLVIFEDGKEVYAKSIVVNDPMDYGGLRFYQSSYQSTQQLFATIENQQTGKSSRFNAPTRQEIKWPAEGVTFGITNVDGPDFRGRYRMKIWFSEGLGAPSEFWMSLGETVNIERPEATYSFGLKERYATGLQVAKDPGVGTVYFGFILMGLGLVVVFFMAHRRLWVHVAAEGSRARIVLSGRSNKNKQAFADNFAILEEKLGQAFSEQLVGPKEGLEKHNSLNLCKE